MMKTKEMLALDRNFLRNHLHCTFVLLPMREQSHMTQDTEVEVYREKIITTKTMILTTYIVLHLEIDLIMTQILLPHNTHDQDMTNIKEIQDPIDRLTDLHIDPLIDVTLVTDIDHVRNPEITTILQDIHLLFDHLQDQETLYHLDHGHIPIPETSLIQYTHKLKVIQLTLKYACIT